MLRLLGKAASWIFVAHPAISFLLQIGLNHGFQYPSLIFCDFHTLDLSKNGRPWSWEVLFCFVLLWCYLQFLKRRADQYSWWLAEACEDVAVTPRSHLAQVNCNWSKSRNDQWQQESIIDLAPMYCWSRSLIKGRCASKMSSLSYSPKCVRHITQSNLVFFLRSLAFFSCSILLLSNSEAP